MNRSGVPRFYESSRHRWPSPIPVAGGSDRHPRRRRCKNGAGGIRTLGTVARTPHFQCGPFSRSDTAPQGVETPAAYYSGPAPPGQRPHGESVGEKDSGRQGGINAEGASDHSSAAECASAHGRVRPPPIVSIALQTDPAKTAGDDARRGCESKSAHEERVRTNVRRRN